MQSRAVLACITVIAMTACANSQKINRVQIGMTRAEVESTLGKPVSVSAQGDRQYLNYKLAETGDEAFVGNLTPYYVRLINGKVESFGRTGDFNSTQVPTVRQQTETIQTEDTYTALLKLKELKDKGLLTEAEFETRRQQILADSK